MAHWEMRSQLSLRTGPELLVLLMKIILVPKTVGAMTYVPISTTPQVERSKLLAQLFNRN